ncbi:MAG: PqqD family protein [Erythrobacter sp.]|nr:MAG: PqqD family protein [Erythrobacter sp.]
MELTDRVQQSSEVVAREVGGETVLLHLTEGTYFGLNPVGGRIWSFLDGQVRTLGEVCAMLVEEYEVDESEARADVLALASDLCANGLLDTVKG